MGDVGVALSVGTGAVVGLAMFAGAPQLIELLGGSGDIAGPAVTYLRILAFAVPITSAIFALQSVFSGVGATRVAMYTAVVVNAVDSPLGVIMIFGLGWGVVVAGVSTVLGAAAGLGFMIWYGRRRLPAELELLRRRHLPGWRALVPRLWPIAWPESTWLFIGYLNEVVLIVFIAHLGVVEVASYRVLWSVTDLLITISTACGVGVSIVVGQRIGAGEPEEALAYRRAGLRLAAVLTAVPATAALLFPRVVFGLLTDDPVVASVVVSTVAVALLKLVAVVPAMNLWGVLLAAGDTRTIMIASLVSDVVLLVPLAWLLALPLGLGLHGVFLAWIAWWVGWGGWLAVRYRQNAWRVSLPSGDGGVS